MKWQKEFDVNYSQYFDILLYAMIFFLIISLFSNESYLFAIIGLFTAYLLLNKWYDSVLAHNFTLHNPKNNIRLFQGEHDELVFQFANHSRIPFLNGTFSFQTGTELEIDGQICDEDQIHSISVSFSIMGKGKTILKLPITAMRRGTATIKNISYEFPHLFNFNVVRLIFLPHYYQEIIVYPKLKLIQGIEKLTQIQEGHQHTYYSPFEDILSPVGTRDYEFSDPFQRINWKATAKMQQLQSNVYDKVVDHSFLFIINLETKFQWGSKEASEYQEDLLSYTAFLIDYAYKQGLPYEIFMNDRRLGKVNYAHIVEGEGKSHYARSLELLARVRQYTIVYPFDHMIYRVGQRLGKRRTVVIIGDLQPKDRQMINLWSPQHRIFSTHITTEGAIVVPLENEVKRHAK